MRRIRRRYRLRARGSLPPGAIVGIVAAIVLVAAIITGNVLNSCLDDDTYRRLTEGETDTTEETDAPPRRTSPAVRAYAFRLGSALSSLGSDPPSALALPLNTADGEMLYRLQRCRKRRAKHVCSGRAGVLSHRNLAGPAPR